jgi:predicted enzyme related to lactoylglutathione lyase
LISPARRICTSMARPIVHLELHTPNLGDACAFYRALLGWQPEPVRASGRCYQAVDLGGRASGGIVECGTERALWLPYAEVPNVAAVTEQASELGARVLLGPRDGPAGWRSVVVSPCGGEIAFWQRKR